MTNRKHGASAPTPLPIASDSTLSRARQRNGVSLEQVAQRTKISLRFLKAIEAEDFGQLPGGVFSTSYVRQYAEASGLDADDLLERYQKQINPQPESTPQPKRPVQQRGFFDRLFRVPA